MKNFFFETEAGKRLSRRVALLLCLALIVGLVPAGIWRAPVQVNAVPNDNLILNGDFEASSEELVNWNQTAGKASYVTPGKGVDGSNALHIVGKSQEVQSDLFAVTSGAYLTIAFNAMQEAEHNKGLSVYALWFNEDGSWYDPNGVGDLNKYNDWCVSFVASLSGDWQQTVKTLVVPEGAAKVAIRFYMSSSAAADSNLYIDNVVVTEEVPSKPAADAIYSNNFDGEFTRTEWTDSKSRTNDLPKNWTAWQYQQITASLISGKWGAADGKMLFFQVKGDKWVRSDAIAATAGTTYTVAYSEMDYIVGGENYGGYAAAIFVDADGNELAVVTNAIKQDTAAQVWSSASFEATAPAGTVAMHIEFGIKDAVGNPEFGVDNLAVYGDAPAATEPSTEATVPSTEATEPSTEATEPSQPSNVVFTESFNEYTVPEGKPSSVKIPNGWTPNKLGANLACAKYDQFDGTTNLAIQSNGWWIKSSVIAVDAGSTYTATFVEKKFVTDVTATGGYIKMIFVDANGEVVAEFKDATGASTTWTEMSFAHVAPAGATGLYIELGIVDATGGDPMFSVDNLVVTVAAAEAPEASEPATEPSTEATEPSTEATEPALENVTAGGAMKDYAAANGWTDATQYTSLKLDGVVSVALTGGQNTGKYYNNGNNWRIYQTEAATVTITADGNTIVSVKITYESNKTGCLTLNGANIESAQVVTVNADSVTFGIGNTGTASNGQVRITAIEVVYAAAATTDPEVTEPSTEATEPSTEATEPSTEATEPSTEATEPVSGESFYAVMNQVSLGKKLYFTGAMNGYYLATTENAAEAAVLYKEVVDGGFKLYFLNGNVKTYIVLTERDGGKANVNLSTTNASVFTMLEAANTPVTTVAGNQFYLGTYGTYKTFSASAISYITGSNASKVDVSQFPLRLEAIVVEEPEVTEPSTEATEPSTEATEPSTEATEPSTEATEPSTEPDDGVILPNGDFEAGLDGWKNFNADISNEGAYAGSGAALILAGTAPSYLQSNRIPVVPGETYHLSAMVKRLSGEKQGYIGFWYVDANGAYVDADGAVAVRYSADEWTEVTMDWTAPEGVAYFWIEFGVNSKAETSFLIDNIVVAKVVDEPEVTEPSTEATEPSTEATEPSTEATEPSTEATEPSTEATEPSTEATEPKTEFGVVADPKPATPMKGGMVQTALGKTLYFTGEMDGYYLATTEDVNAAVDLYLEAVEGGYKLYFLKGDVKTYIDIYDRGNNKAGVQLAETTETVFTFNSELKTLITTIGENDFYLGTYGTYTTVSVSSTYYITGENASKVDSEQYLLRFYAETVVEGGDDNTGTGDNAALIPVFGVMAAVAVLAVLVICKRKHF